MKKMKIIFWGGIYFFIVFAIILLWLSIMLIMTFYHQLDSFVNAFLTVVLNSGLFFILLFLVLISWVFSITLLSIKFDNPEVNKSKVLWGWLSLFLLGPIGWIIFATINQNKLINNSEFVKNWNMKKIKLILNLGITSLALSSIFVFLLSVLIFFATANTGIDITHAWNSALIVLTFVLVVSLILAVVGSILILSTDFKNNYVNDSKILWGLLSLFLIGPIGLIVFAKKNQQKLVDKSVDDNTSKTSSFSFKQINDQLGDIAKNFKLFEAGEITKEEFDKIKEKNLSK